MAEAAPEQTKELTPYDNARRWLMSEGFQKQVQMALPKHLTADRLTRIALTSIRKNPLLAECDVRSLCGAVIEAAQVGLEPDGILGGAYLVPYYNSSKKCYEAQLIIGYKGYIDLARRSGQVNSISARMVYKKDDFDYAYGANEFLTHKPSMDDDPGEPVCVYAVARLKDGDPAFEVLPMTKVNKTMTDALANKKNKAGSPWTKHFDEMARKTAVRRLAKYLPLSPEMQRAVTLDEYAEAGVPQDLGAPDDYIDITPEPTTSDRVADTLKAKAAEVNASEAGESPAQAEDPAEGATYPEPTPAEVLSGLLDSVKEFKHLVGILRMPRWRNSYASITNAKQKTYDKMVLARAKDFGKTLADLS